MESFKSKSLFALPTPAASGLWAEGDARLPAQVPDRKRLAQGGGGFVIPRRFLCVCGHRNRRGWFVDRPSKWRAPAGSALLWAQSERVSQFGLIG